MPLLFAAMIALLPAQNMQCALLVIVLPLGSRARHRTKHPK